MKKVTGAITAIVTPFQNNGSIDIDVLKNIVQFQLKGNIDGIVPCGSTGEAATLNSEEYQLIIKTVVEEVKGKVPVIAGAGSNDTQKAINFSQFAKEAGADGLLHVTPFYNKPTPKGLTAHFKAIANATNLPIILYNVPGRTGLNVNGAQTIQLAKDVPEIVGVKEASANIPQMMEIIKSAPSYFSVLSGDDTFTLPLISVGGVGCISVVANEVPKDFTHMTKFALDGDFKRAKQIHYRLLDLMNINFIETNPIPVKTALVMMKKVKDVFRLPLISMEEKNKIKLKQVLREVGLI